MISSYQTANDICYLNRQTTDMAPLTIEQTVSPTALSNIMKSQTLVLNCNKISIHTAKIKIQNK